MSGFRITFPVILVQATATKTNKMETYWAYAEDPRHYLNVRQGHEATYPPPMICCQGRTRETAVARLKKKLDKAMAANGDTSEILVTHLIIQ